MKENKFYFFWGRGNGYFLSQWFPCKFKVDNIVYNCSEQYMMAQKSILFNDTIILKKIMADDDPKKQKDLGRAVKNFQNDKWDQVARDIIYQGNWYKFNQNKGLKSKLLETEGLLTEASPYDTKYGIGLYANDPRAQFKETWLGKNWLGEVLTAIREDIKLGNGPQKHTWS